MLRRVDGANGAVGLCQSASRRSKKNSKNFPRNRQRREFNAARRCDVEKRCADHVKRKALFSTDQLVQVCEHMFDKLPFVVFKDPADACPYVVIIFSPNCQYGDVCEVKTRVEIFKKEAAMDNFLIRFKVECIFTPEKYIQHLLDRSPGFVIKNENCGMGKKLAALLFVVRVHKQRSLE